MVTLLFRQSNDDLFEERKRFVDELSFHKSLPFAAGLFGPFTSGQVDKIDFAHDDLFRTFDFASDFKMNGKDAVTSGTVPVKFMLCYSAVVLSFKKHLKGFFLIFGRLFGQSFDNDVSFGVFLDVHLVLIIFIQQITKSLIVQFEIRDGNLDLVLVPGVDFLIKLRNQSGHESSVLVITLGPSHGESFACARLSVTEHILSTRPMRLLKLTWRQGCKRLLANSS